MMIGETNMNENQALKKNEDKILTLLESGVFDLDYGKVEINVHNGKIVNVYINRRTYTRSK